MSGIGGKKAKGRRGRKPPSPETQAQFATLATVVCLVFAPMLLWVGWQLFPAALAALGFAFLWRLVPQFRRDGPLAWTPRDSTMVLVTFTSVCVVCFVFAAANVSARNIAVPGRVGQPAEVILGGRRYRYEGKTMAVEFENDRRRIEVPELYELFQTSGDLELRPATVYLSAFGHDPVAVEFEGHKYTAYGSVSLREMEILVVGILLGTGCLVAGLVRRAWRRYRPLSEVDASEQPLVYPQRKKRNRQV